MHNPVREKLVIDKFNELLAESGKLPATPCYHALINLAVPIERGSVLTLGAIHRGNLAVFSQCRTNLRVGMGTYRVGVFIFPEEPAAGVVIPSGLKLV